MKCLRCGLLKPRDVFVKDRTRAGGVFPWCKECHAEYQRRYIEENREKVNERKRAASHAQTLKKQNALGERFCPICKKPITGKVTKVFCGSRCSHRATRLDMYGLDPEGFDKLIATGKCPLCGVTVRKRWEIDHNHQTGATTGAVCSRCNQYLLTGSKHDVEIAKRLVEYLTLTPVERVYGEKRYGAPPGTSTKHRIWLWTGKPPIKEENPPAQQVLKELDGKQK